MEHVLLILSFILVLGGVLGSILPMIPGPPLSWSGMLVLSFVNELTISIYLLVISLLLVLIVGILDYIVPAIGTKRYGGSKYGVWGTNIGLLVGIFAPIPLGFIIGPFLGALIGELIHNQKDIVTAFKASVGSFIGFLASTFIKFILSICILGWYIVEIYQNWSIWF